MLVTNVNVQLADAAMETAMHGALLKIDDHVCGTFLQVKETFV